MDPMGYIHYPEIHPEKILQRSTLAARVSNFRNLKPFQSMRRMGIDYLPGEKLLQGKWLG